MRIPPELMTAEQRRARITELEQEIPRQWLRFALTEVAVMWLPFITFLTLYAFTDAIRESWLTPGTFVAIAVSFALFAYWLVKRVLPLQRELRALKGVEA